eukprot:TRINITY_DN7180_c0_g1_i11.p1 TRINITY_DN7180_c0_g1~~TRINITY_DN7180_c0_g1_i11.p1  ORF type:complete len:201 (+),score=33.75 TRINITY_DN7180_c0_g1_i11:302-904(+)
MGIFIQNKHTGPLEQFESTIQGFPEILLKVAPPQTSTVAPGEQVRQRVDVRLEQPFVTPPTLSVRFVADGVPVSITLTVPIATCKFATAYTLTDPKQFAGVWGQGAASESQQTIKTNRAFEQSAICNLLKAFKCDMCLGIDKPQNLVAGAQLVTATGRQWMLLRIECAPAGNQFRITGRATTAEFAQSMVELVVDQLTNV